ncbi:hypothetical protein ACVIGB_000617 [Bradyrhizobium sp. USDA 4341]
MTQMGYGARERIQVEAVSKQTREVRSPREGASAVDRSEANVKAHRTSRKPISEIFRQPGGSGGGIARR